MDKEFVLVALKSAGIVDPEAVKKILADLEKPKAQPAEIDIEKIIAAMTAGAGLSEK